MENDPWLRPEWGRAALLVIDTQNDFLDGGASPIAGTTGVLPAIGRVVDAFRAAARPVVHVVRIYEGDDVDLARRTLLAAGAPIVRAGSAGSQVAAELSVAPLAADDLLAGRFQPVGPAEWVMWKPRWGAFHRTGLDGFLRDRDVSTVVVAGCNFPNCPRATLIGASERDYRVVAASDAISGVQPWHLEEAGRIGVVPVVANTIVERMGGL